MMLRRIKGEKQKQWMVNTESSEYHLYADAIID